MISFKELTEIHKFDKETVIRTVSNLKETDRLFLYCNHMFDSSHFGRMHLLIVGPGRTSETPPKEIDPDDCGGLPSRREQLVGEVDIEDVKKE